MKIHRNISEINSAQWDKLVEKSPVSSFFQTKECYVFYASLSFLKPFVFAVSEDEKLVGLICGYIVADGGKIKQFFSSRAIVPGGLLLAENISGEALHKLLDFTIKSLNNKIIYIEIRNYNDYSFFKKKIEIGEFKYQPHLDVHLSINADTEKNINESKRHEIRTALKNDVQYFATKDITEIEQFYKILQHLYQKEIKLPLFPLEFFLKLVQLPDGKIFIVKQKDTIIGGMAGVVLAQKTFYEWFACGDKSATRRLYPSVMATFAGIDYAMKNGFQTYDFMGAGKPGKLYGVRNFKSKFGGKTIETGRFLYIAKPLLYYIGKAVIQLIKKKK